MEDQYKMIMDENRITLYNIPKDASEQNNLAVELPKVTQRMQNELLQWKQEVMQELKTVTGR